MERKLRRQQRDLQRLLKLIGGDEGNQLHFSEYKPKQSTPRQSPRKSAHVRKKRVLQQTPQPPSTPPPRVHRKPAPPIDLQTKWQIFLKQKQIEGLYLKHYFKIWFQHCLRAMISRKITKSPPTIHTSTSSTLCPASSLDYEEDDISAYHGIENALDEIQSDIVDVFSEESSEVDESGNYRTKVNIMACLRNKTTLDRIIEGTIKETVESSLRPIPRKPSHQPLMLHKSEQEKLESNEDLMRKADERIQRLKNTMIRDSRREQTTEAIHLSQTMELQSDDIKTLEPSPDKQSDVKEEDTSFIQSSEDSVKVEDDVEEPTPHSDYSPFEQDEDFSAANNNQNIQGDLSDKSLSDDLESLVQSSESVQIQNPQTEPIPTEENIFEHKVEPEQEEEENTQYNSIPEENDATISITESEHEDEHEGNGKEQGNESISEEERAEPLQISESDQKQTPLDNYGDREPEIPMDESPGKFSDDFSSVPSEDIQVQGDTDTPDTHQHENVDETSTEDIKLVSSDPFEEKPTSLIQKSEEDKSDGYSNQDSIDPSPKEDSDNLPIKDDYNGLSGPYPVDSPQRDGSDDNLDIKLDSSSDHPTNEQGFIAHDIEDEPIQTTEQPEDEDISLSLVDDFDDSSSPPPPPPAAAKHSPQTSPVNTSGEYSDIMLLDSNSDEYDSPVTPLLKPLTIPSTKEINSSDYSDSSDEDAFSEPTPTPIPKPKVLFPPTSSPKQTSPLFRSVDMRRGVSSFSRPGFQTGMHERDLQGNFSAYLRRRVTPEFFKQLVTQEIHSEPKTLLEQCPRDPDLPWQFKDDYLDLVSQVINNAIVKTDFTLTDYTTFMSGLENFFKDALIQYKNPSDRVIRLHRMLVTDIQRAELKIVFDRADSLLQDALNSCLFQM